MKGKVLLNVYSIQVKNDLLSIFIENSMDVLEVLNRHDLIFKHRLIKENLDIYVQEFDESHYEESLEQLRLIDRDEVRCVLVIHDYSSQIIDDALALKVKDIIVLPMKRDDLRRKLLPPVYKVTKAEPMPKEPFKDHEVPEPLVVFDDEPLQIEIARSNRGNYPLSLVMVQTAGFAQDANDIFEDELRHLLRTTDELLPFDQESILILCPFTTKTNLVAVENKVREALAKVRFKGFTAGKMFLYGVTYPLDGKSSKTLQRMLLDGIHDSRLFSELEGPLNQLTQKDVRNRLRRRY